MVLWGRYVMILDMLCGALGALCDLYKSVLGFV